MKLPIIGYEVRNPFIRAARAIPASAEDLPNRTVNADPFSDWYLSSSDKLPPKMISSILRQGRAGSTWQKYLLYQQMLRTWPEFAKCTYELRSSIAQNEFVVHPYCEDGEEPTKSAQEKADLVSRALSSFKPDRFQDEDGLHGLVFDLTEAIMIGVSVEELIWNENGVDPKGQPEKQVRAAAWVHPRHYNFSGDGSIGITQSDNDGLAFPSQAKSKPLLNNPSKFLVARFKNKSGTCLGAGFMEVLAPVWVGVTYGWDYMLNFMQKYGNPFVAIPYQQGIPQAEIDKFVELCKKLSNQNFCVYPNVGEVSVVAAQNLSGDSAHLQLRRVADECARLVILGQTLTSSPQNATGSYALGAVHQDIRAERIEGMLKWVATILTEQFAESLLIENYGDSSERPTIAPDLTRPLSVQEQAQLMSALSMCTVPYPKKDAYEKLMVPMPQPGDEVLIMGKPTIMEEAMTEDEYKEKEFELQLNQQMEMAQVEAQTQQPQPKGKGKPKAKASTVHQVREILAKASPADLLKLEPLILAAERAPHHNGELNQLTAALETIKARQ